MTQALSVRDIQGATLDARTDRLPNDLFSAGLFVSGDEFKVQQQASPNMTIRVGSGVAGDRYVVPGTHAQGTFLVLNRNDPYVGSANSDLPIANGNGANPRIDGIDLRVYDDEADSSGFTKAEVVVTQGTPGSSPTAPAVPSGAARLATILVDATESTSIGSGDITDTRVLSYPVGGIARRTSATRPASPWEGLTVDETDTDRLVRYNGTAWQTVANLGALVDITAGITYTNINAGGAGAVIVQKAKREGMWCTVRFSILFGAAPSTATAAFFTLPAATPWDFTAISDGSSQVGKLWLLDSGTRHYVGTCRIAPNTRQVDLIHSEAGGAGLVGGADPFTVAAADQWVGELAYELKNP